MEIEHEMQTSCQLINKVKASPDIPIQLCLNQQKQMLIKNAVSVPDRLNENDVQ